jgi:hypothetical protein
MITTKVESYQKSSKIEYPCLMTTKEGDVIVLCSSEDEGTVLVNNNNTAVRPMGYHGRTWNSTYFIPFKGSITLTQE